LMAAAWLSLPPLRRGGLVVEVGATFQNHVPIPTLPSLVLVPQRLWAEVASLGRSRRV